MKATFGIVLLASVVFGIFSTVYGMKATKLRPSFSQRSASREDRDRDYRRFERNRSSLHNVVRGVSIPFYLICLGALVVSFVQSSGHLAWRVVVAIAGVIAVVMIFWSCILSGGVSFDEVFFVWIVSAVLFAVIAVTALFRKTDPIRV